MAAEHDQPVAPGGGRQHVEGAERALHAAARLVLGGLARAGATTQLEQRGNVVGDYMYPFIEIGTIGFGPALINAGGGLAGFVLIALLVLAADRGRKQAGKARPARVGR